MPNATRFAGRWLLGRTDRRPKCQMGHKIDDLMTFGVKSQDRFPLGPFGGKSALARPRAKKSAGFFVLAITSLLASFVMPGGTR